MINKKRQLIVTQLDQILNGIKPLRNLDIPQKGWLFQIRTSLNMSRKQMANQLEITPQSVKEMEEREVSGSITLRTLQEAANALNMKLVYGLIPKDESIQKMIEKRTEEVAKIIVLRTSNSMKLEDQENSKERIEKAIAEKASELKYELPKFLWDKI